MRVDIRLGKKRMGKIKYCTATNEGEAWGA